MNTSEAIIEVEVPETKNMSFSRIPSLRKLFEGDISDIGCGADTTLDISTMLADTSICDGLVDNALKELKVRLVEPTTSHNPLQFVQPMRTIAANIRMQNIKVDQSSRFAKDEDPEEWQESLQEWITKRRNKMRPLIERVNAIRKSQLQKENLRRQLEGNSDQQIYLEDIAEEEKGNEEESCKEDNEMLMQEIYEDIFKNLDCFFNENINESNIICDENEYQIFAMNIDMTAEKPSKKMHDIVLQENNSNVLYNDDMDLQELYN